MSAPPSRWSDLWRERPLTAGERGLARAVFGRALPLDPIRLVKARALPSRFAVATPFDRVVFCAHARLSDDFAAADLAAQSWLIHELTHLWQARRGVVLPLAKLGALGRRSYAWRLRPGARFSTYNIEQQAEMTAAAFLWTRGLACHADAPRLAQAFATEAERGAAPAVFLARSSLV